MSLATRLLDLTTRVATESKALRTLLNGNQPDLAALTTTAKTNLVAAINELDAEIATASGIDDLTTSTTSSWSSQKTRTEIDAAIDALVAGAPGALDTLLELANRLEDDADAAAAIAADVATRVSYTAVQSLTAPQQAQARSNIGAVAIADVGNTDTDFVATFEAGLV